MKDSRRNTKQSEAEEQKKKKHRYGKAEKEIFSQCKSRQVSLH